MISILLAICLAVEGTAFYLYNRILFSPRRKKIHCLITYFSAYFLVFLLHSFSSYYSVIINIIVFLSANIFIQLFLYKLSFFSALIHSLFISCFSIISETFIGEAFLQFAKNIWHDISNVNNLILLSPSVIIFFLLTIAAAFIEKAFLRNGARIGELTIVILLTAIAFISTVFNYIGIIGTTDYTKKNYYLTADIIIFCVLLVGFMLMYNYMRVKESITSRQKILDQSEKNNAAFITEMKERDSAQRILIHDIKKHLAAIQVMSQDGNNKAINEYIQKITKSTAFSSPIKYCNNDYMNSVLFKYQKDAIKSNIDFSIDSNPIDFAFLDNFDLTVIMCNILDNAFNAARNSDKKTISITFSQDLERNICMIIITNSCNDTVRFSQGIPISNKPEGFYHGLGIKSVIKVLQKYNGDINLYQDEENFFHTVILLSRGDSDANSHM